MLSCLPSTSFTPAAAASATRASTPLRPRPVAFKTEIARSLRQRVWPLIESGAIRPVIHSTFPAAQAALAAWRLALAQQVQEHVDALTMAQLTATQAQARVASAQPVFKAL